MFPIGGSYSCPVSNSVLIVHAQADTIMTAPRIDQEVLDDVVQRGFDRKAVVDALKTRSQSKVPFADVAFRFLVQFA